MLSDSRLINGEFEPNFLRNPSAIFFNFQHRADLRTNLKNISANKLHFCYQFTVEYGFSFTSSRSSLWFFTLTTALCQ
jgi:hypothetical protein